ncbi:hypothetical protein F2Q69_00049488 [Brassica cretica]|nr:hypothetical protein F2Q69_00049488 [Brassica cretica]
MWLTPFANSYLLHANLESSTWIAWAINTTSKDMLGAQALVAYLSAEYLDRQMTILVTMVMVLPSNTTVVNHLWQDGPLKRDRLGMHAMSDDNNTSTSSRHEENDMSSTGLYRLEIVGIELLSLYGTVETTEMAAEKKSQFPPSRRRKLKSDDKSLKDAYL